MTRDYEWTGELGEALGQYGAQRYYELDHRRTLTDGEASELREMDALLEDYRAPADDCSTADDADTDDDGR